MEKKIDITSTALEKGIDIAKSFLDKLITELGELFVTACKEKNTNSL